MLLPSLPGRELRALRAAFVVTQPEVAMALGVSVTTVQRLERRDHAIGDDLAARLGRYLLGEREAGLELGLAGAALRVAGERAGLLVWHTPGVGPLFWRPTLWWWAAHTRTRHPTTLAVQALDLADQLGFGPGEGVLLCDVCAEHEGPAAGVAFRECSVCRRNLCGSGDCGDEVVVPGEDAGERLRVVCSACWPGLAKEGTVRFGLGGSGVAGGVAEGLEAEYLRARASGPRGADLGALGSRVAEVHDYFEAARFGMQLLVDDAPATPPGLPNVLAGVRAALRAAEVETTKLAKLLARVERDTIRVVGGVGASGSPGSPNQGCPLVQLGPAAKDLAQTKD